MSVGEVNFYSFFTKYSLLDEYGFSSGLLNRLFRKVLPTVPDGDTAEHYLLGRENSVSYIVSRMDFDAIPDSPIARQLDLSLIALCSKVVAFGLDNHVKAKYTYLQLDSGPFEDLQLRICHLSKRTGTSDCGILNSLGAVESLIIKLRKNKDKIGTNFHLTLITRRMLEYTARIRELVDLRANIRSRAHWEVLLEEYIQYSRSKDSLRRYVDRHADLVALEIVEHTSSKGQHYIAEDRKEYWSFFYKSLLGGGIIALFAFLKIIVNSYQLSPFGYAFWYSLNYALCFVLVKQLGGIIATKQPALTASTIAKNIDKRGDLRVDSINSVTVLVRKAIRSQFISVIGNFLMALTLAGVLMYALELFDVTVLADHVRPDYLIGRVVPSVSLVFYAAVAGFFLALSGLISGYVDNKVVSSKIARRVRGSRRFFNSRRLATFVDKKIGVFVGNVSLGIFLGTAFLLSYLLPFQVDIRHIAFSSANAGFALVKLTPDVQIVLLALTGALLIGLVNFTVSFAITLYLALKSRGAGAKLIPEIISSVLKDFVKNPLRYFIMMADEKTADQDIS